MDNLQRMYNSLDVILANTSIDKFKFSDHLDKSYLDLIYSDDLEYAEEMFDLFLQNTENDIDKLITFMRQEYHSAVYQIAHKIKPTFAMVGLAESGKIMESVEEKAISGIGDYVELLEEVQQIKQEKLVLVKQELIRIKRRGIN